VNPQQAASIVKELNFDFVEITGGGLGAGKHLFPRPGPDKYYYRHVVEEFNKHKLMQKQPVIVTGGFTNLTEAEQALSDGATLVGFGRKFLRDDKFILVDNNT